MSNIISAEFLNFLNFGDDEEEDEKQLVGLRQASGRRQKLKLNTRSREVNFVPMQYVL